LHTARCLDCGILLYFPYPTPSLLEVSEDEVTRAKNAEYYFSWYARSGKNNHYNFSKIIEYTIQNLTHEYSNYISVLDYGGGGGQFALVMKSLLPRANVYIADINDHALLSEYSIFNKQIKWKHFESDATTFDYIFLNDVFEHVHDPLLVLETLKNKLKPNGILFIDTPRQMWLYPVLNFFSSTLYNQLLKGTVSLSHLQIWSKTSFRLVAKKGGYKIRKYSHVNEFTMNLNHYLRNFGITGYGALVASKLLYKFSSLIFKNKIMAVMERE
jgi:2-polyprenyl-3-methyl-5-hydroxy-6-metoxy-1,4-benzoquinol methylase